MDCWEKTRSSNLPCSRLLLRPVLKAGQQESAIVALQSTRNTVNYWSKNMAPYGRRSALLWALDAAHRDPDKRKLARFSCFNLKKKEGECLIWTSSSVAPLNQLCLFCTVGFQGSVVKFDPGEEVMSCFFRRWKRLILRHHFKTEKEKWRQEEGRGCGLVVRRERGCVRGGACDMWSPGDRESAWGGKGRLFVQKAGRETTVGKGAVTTLGRGTAAARGRLKCRGAGFIGLIAGARLCPSGVLWVTSCFWQFRCGINFYF